jgi:glutathione S-transferase
MKLYFSPGACSLAPRIVMHELGMAFESEKVNGKTKVTASGADFREINPKAYVPALQLDSGEVLTEAAIIMQYLADQKPGNGLLAAGGMDRYRVQEWLHFTSTEVHKSFSPLFAPHSNDGAKEYARKNLETRYTYLDRQLAGKEYLHGGQFTIADAYLFVITTWAQYVAVDLSPYPNVLAFQARIVARPSVQAAMREEGLIKE